VKRKKEEGGEQSKAFKKKNKRQLFFPDWKKKPKTEPKTATHERESCLFPPWRFFTRLRAQNTTIDHHYSKLFIRFLFFTTNSFATAIIF